MRPSNRLQKDDDALLEDERVPLVRWPRIWFALSLIVIAIIWLIIDNRLGIVDRTLVATPTPQLARAVPMLATPQAFGGVNVDAKLRAYVTQVGTQHVPAGSRFLLLAVLVTNSSAAPVAVSPVDFHVRADGRTIATGIGYPGQADQLSTSALAPGAQAEGNLLFLVPYTLQGAMLTYAPHASGMTGVQWHIS